MSFKRGRGIDGRWVLLALLIFAVIVVPTATWLTLRWVESALIEPARLDWSHRELWRPSPVRWTAMRRQGLSVSPDAGPWRELDFELSREREAVVRECSEVAQYAADHPDEFVGDAFGTVLLQLSERDPDNFYPIYLLATWHRLRGEASLAHGAYRTAFRLAHGAVQQRYVSTDGSAVPDLAVGTFAITHARSDGRELDESLVLIYPALVTEHSGYVRMPVFDTVYRIDRAPQPRGHRVAYHFEQWFQFPTRIGTLRPAVVDEQANNATP